MGLFGKKKDKEKKGFFGWKKRNQEAEPERDAEIVPSESASDDVAAQLLAEREAARQAEAEKWREQAEAEIAAEQAEAAALAAKAAQEELFSEENEEDEEDEEDEIESDEELETEPAAEEELSKTAVVEDKSEPDEAGSQQVDPPLESEEDEPKKASAEESLESEQKPKPETVNAEEEAEPKALEDESEEESLESEEKPEVEDAGEELESEEPEKKKKGLFEKIRDGLRKTKDSVIAKMQLVLNAFTKIDEDLFDQLEETMIMGDMGAETSIEICDQLRKRVKERGITDPKQIMGLIQEIIGEMLGEDQSLNLQTKPSVIMVIGVNGAGKTTTIGKLCHQLKAD